MKITDIKINNFGKLNNKNIELKNNINIIYGENESGKSTLLKFITSMLYGINRNKAGNYASDFDRFTPWNSEDFSGKISYELDDGKKYEIYRDFTKKNPKIFNENMEDITKEFSVDKTKGSKFFYDQTQVDEELFLSTIVSEQQGVKLEAKEQNSMIQKITNIIGTGEDNISYQNTINKLNKKITNEIGTKNTKEKPINILEKRKKDLEEEIKYLDEFNQEKYDIDQIKQEEINLIKEKENEIEIAKEINQIENNQIIEREKIKLARESEQEKNIEIENLKEELKKVNKSEIKNPNKKIKIILAILILLLGLGLAVVIKPIIYKIIAIFCGVLISGIIFLNYYRIFKKNNDVIKEIQNKKTNYEKEIEKQEKILEEKIKENNTKEDNIDFEYKNKKEKINLKYKDKIENKKLEEIINTKNINEKIREIENIINESKLNLHRIEIDEKNVLPKLESLSQKTEELEDVNEELENLVFLEKAIIMAKENIEEAYLEMKNNVSPKFTNKLSETINNISNGKYNNVKISDEYGLIVENEKGDYIPVSALSIGTIDQLYLSLRLATIDDISKEKLPIILDETFAYFDDKRLKNIIKFLIENYYDRQIIIFTCTKREQKLMKENNYKFNEVNM